MLDTLEQFLREVYGNDTNDICTPYTLGSGAKAYIRFELGGELENGSKERVEQAVNRVQSIYEESFVEERIWVLIYEYKEGVIFNNSDNSYLHKQFHPEVLQQLYQSKKTITTNMLEPLEATVIIGTPYKSQVNSRNIFTGMASLEMGLEPAIGQDVYFICPVNGTILYMYDDRGCDLIAPNTHTIRHIFEKFNGWILDYDRKHIEERFQ